MRLAVLLIVVVFGLVIGAVVSAYPGEFETPSTPLPIQSSSAYAHYDVQLHNRGDNVATWDATVNAQHTNTCGAPPGTFPVLALSDSVYICNGHVMTAAAATGYGEIVLTPAQIMNCSTGCTVQWDMSTERMSQRDWPDVWLTPWDDNLALPVEDFIPDLQGKPRRGIHVGAQPGNNSFTVSTIDNFTVTALPVVWWEGMGTGIQSGVNQSAVRQTFRLTVTAGHVRFERLPSATAAGFVFADTDANPLLASDYVVSFAQHSYNPTKDGAGIPATWHWSNFELSNASPFTLIHSTPLLVQQTATVTFDAPAPANAMLRFSGVCKVYLDGALAPRRSFNGQPESASNYWVPIAEGKQNIGISFEADYNGPCSARDFHVWSKAGGPPSTPTPTPTSTSVPPTPTPVGGTSTPTVVPTATATPLSPTATPTAIPPTSTPDAPRRQCTLRWGNNTIESYGNLTQAECAARGQ